MPRHVDVPTPADLHRARHILQERLYPTPLVRIAPASGGDRWLKLESMQPTGSFKIRGALAAMYALGAEQRIVTASAGNHALGVAWASRELGVPATIVVAETASPVKIEKLRALGADLVLHGGSYDEAEAHAIDLASQGAHYLSPYNDTNVIAGQATVLDSILQQVPVTSDPITIAVPVGGGGLLAGMATRLQDIGDTHITLVGVETEASTAVSSSVAAGRTVEVQVGETLADGLAGNIEPGSVTVDIIRRARVPMMTVTEDEIRAAIRDLFHTHGIIAEGSAATAYAAMQVIETDQPIIGVITGRNIAWPTLRDILDHPAMKPSS
jgi:threonine dehydratase